MCIDLTYVGNHSVHVLASGLNLNQLDPKYFSMGAALLNQVPNPFFGIITSSGCGLDGATISQGQLLRPHPEFCNINENQSPAGDGRYNALDVNYTHRVSQGLTLLASYTFSKFLDNVGGPNAWANASANFGENIRNVYNLAAEKSVDANDVTHSFVLSYVYELPVGKGRKYGAGMNSVVNAIIGDWQTSGVATFKGGFPLRINVDNQNPFGVGQNANVVGDYHVSNQTVNQWFNTAGIRGAQQVRSRKRPTVFLRSALSGFQQLGPKYSEIFPRPRTGAFPVPSGYVQRFQPREFLQAGYQFEQRYIRAPYRRLQSAADAGSSQALLVIRGANNLGCCLLFAVGWCLSCRGWHPRNNPISLNRSWPRRKMPRPGAIFSLLLSSTGKRSVSILKFRNSGPTSA